MKALAVLVALTAVGRAESWQLEPSLVIGAEQFDYHEDVGAGLESAHHGVQPTARLEALVTHGRSYARAWFGWTGGTMPFEGTDQSGHPITPAGDASGHMTDSEVDLGHRWASGSWVLGGYVGIGRRTWDRDLRPVGGGGYREDYAWLTFPVSVVAERVIVPGWTAAFEATAVIPKPGTMRVHLSDIDPTYPDVDVALANQVGWRLRLRSDYALSERWRLVAQLALEASWMRQGPATPVAIDGQLTGISEPETHTWRTSLLAGARYRF